MKRNYTVKLARLNSQGYVDGTYFGVNYLSADGFVMRLYEVCDLDGNILGYHRCPTRRDALAVAEKSIANANKAPANSSFLTAGWN